MSRKMMVKTALITGLFFLAFGGWCLHLRIHPPAKDADNLIPLISGILSVFCVPFLFCYRRTIAWAYVLNGFSVILGTVTMAHFSIVHFQGPVTPANILLTTTLADIAVLWAKFVLGKALFDLEFLRSETDLAPKGHFFRYPHMGWWWVHLFSVAVIYALGNILWK
jgi:hypothetical protein